MRTGSLTVHKIDVVEQLADPANLAQYLLFACWAFQLGSCLLVLVSAISFSRGTKFLERRHALFNFAEQVIIDGVRKD